MEILCANVLLPLPVNTFFSYVIPDEMKNVASPGKRVIVPFGERKFYSGIICDVKTRENTDIGYKLKNIEYVLDERCVVNEYQLKFWRWIAEYYIANIGEVAGHALPSLLKITSESYLVLNANFAGDISEADESVISIIEYLHINKKIAVKDVASVAKVENVYNYVHKLISNGIVDMMEEINNPYRPRFEDYVSITPEYRSEAKINEVFKSLEKKSYKQLQFLVAYFRSAGNAGLSFPDIPKRVVCQDIENDSNVIKALVKKKIITIKKVEVGRIVKMDETDSVDNIFLTDTQSVAYNEIKCEFESKNVVLLHGIASSGKTEIYFKLIDEVLKSGGQVLYLLPDIALTTQITARASQYFGRKIGVYHSKYNHNEKVETWNSVLDNNADADTGSSLIFGTRDALFLPFENLKLIIVDDEHDHLYKLNDAAPRFNARDCAVFLSTIVNAKVLLGSATPSIESYYNAKKGRYGLVTLSDRFSGGFMPEIKVVDMKEEVRYDRVTASIYSETMIQEIKRTIEEHGQVLIFRNRRGFSLRVVCESCGWTPVCVNCDVALIHHKALNQMRCHYCGFHTEIPAECPQCHHTGLVMKGYGTEKIEEDLKDILPDVSIARLDVDTTKRKHAYEDIIGDFASGKTNILIGTHMITKGLDFANVGLVCVINADALLYFPDFRSNERAFQELIQLAGRSGRREQRGKFIIQTFSPEHSVIKRVLDNDYESMYLSQLAERMKYHYPPFYRLINIKIKHADYRVVGENADALAALLRQEFGEAVLGPEFEAVPRVRNLYIKGIMLKIGRNAEFKAIKDKFRNICEVFLKTNKKKGLRVIIDVDPY